MMLSTNNTLEYVRKENGRCFWGVRSNDDRMNHYRTGDGGKGVWVSINGKWYEIHWVNNFELPMDDDAGIIETIKRRCFCNKIAIA